MDARNKPSWAFDDSDDSSRNKSTSQSYRIPYPRSSANEDVTEQRFICARAFLVFVNILFFAIGFTVLMTSVAVAARPERCETCHSVLNSLLAIGLVSTLIAMLGIFGALSNSYKTLLVYVTLVAFLFLVQIVVFFWSLFGHANFQRRMHTMFRDKMHNKPQQLIEFLDLVQQRLPCCGVDGPLDYHTAGLQLPLSCCSSSGGDQCTVQTNASSTLSSSNTTVAAGNVTTATTTVKPIKIVATTAPPAKALPAKHMSTTKTTTPKARKTSPKPEETPMKTTKKSTSSNERKTSHQPVETSTAAGIATTTGKKTSVEETKTSPKGQETSTEANKMASTPKARRKRSVTDRPVATTAPTRRTAPTSTKPGNASLIKLNETVVISPNFSINGTAQALEPLFINRTNLTGGPEPWDIHRVKRLGCFTVVSVVVDRYRRYLTIAISVVGVALLSLQLLVLCTAHKVARSNFIQRGY